MQHGAMLVQKKRNYQKTEEKIEAFDSRERDVIDIRMKGVKRSLEPKVDLRSAKKKVKHRFLVKKKRKKEKELSHCCLLLMKFSIKPPPKIKLSFICSTVKSIDFRTWF